MRRPRGRRSGLRPRRGGPWRLLRDLVVVVLVALLVSWGVRSFLVRSFYIPSASMEDTLQIGDRIVVNELVPRFADLKRGDIVVFDDPGGWLGYGGQGEQDLVKRVIGLPGDHVSCCDADGHLLVNGTPLDEPYLLLPAGQARASLTDFDVTVPDGALWVMGDNRNHSGDSRAHQTGPYAGFVPIDHVVGRAFVITWPIDRWRGL
ncbi:signal peptidase I [Frigoribacterium sp. 2-23]|uniref:signal peptidase I n=1 Tax=Frigoribacterium sp. 2-23 TaxID=3415006 RepID=UPI003C6FF17A